MTSISDSTVVNTPNFASMFSNEFQQVVDFRRSNRKFDPDSEVSDEVIRRSIARAVLSPNSSNMQLWEFHWLKSKVWRDRFVPLCLNQNAARTAKHMVVFVTRKDKWKDRARWNTEQIRKATEGQSPDLQKKALDYYGKVMPLVYGQDPLGVMTFVRRTISFFAGLFRPFYRAGGSAMQRITVHKSCALAAQTFMLSIAAEGFHTCPMEGFDEVRVKKALGLPCGAEINMIIAVGKGTEAGIWGPRVRVPMEEVLFQH
ncbi:MAG: hypothetical protein RLZZ630_952 [Bacteroidota bacterium]